MDENPRCFKNVNIKQLGVKYMANKKAWMTKELFSEWLRDVNRQMKREGRHILLFMDNASSHGDLKLSNVTLKYLPPNTTSLIQPLDQGIIRAFKSRYRKKLVRSLLLKIDSVKSASELCREINILDAIQWIVKAWGETSPTTIQKCFRVGGFPSSDHVEASDSEDDLALSTLVKELNGTDEEFINLDHLLPTEDDSDKWEDDIMNEFRPSEIDEPAACSVDDQKYEPEPEPIISYAEAMEMARKLELFALAHEPSLITKAQDIGEVVQNSIVRSKCKKTQSTIEYFFHKKSL